MSAATKNGAAVTDPLLALGAKLLNPTQREEYAQLFWWFSQLPPEDEIVKLARLFGFITLLTRELPELLITESGKLHELVQATDAYHQALDHRLKNLPAEIGGCINIEHFAATMSESFRQQIAATGLEDTGDVLERCVAGLQKVSSDLADSVRPLVTQYAGVGTTVSTELAKLMAGSDQLREHNAHLAAQAAGERWYRRTFLYAALLLVGFLLGLAYEKASTTEMLGAIQEQTAQIEQKLTPLTEVPAPQIQPRKHTSK